MPTTVFSNKLLFLFQNCAIMAIILSPSTIPPFSSTRIVLSASPSRAIPTSAFTSITLLIRLSGNVDPLFSFTLVPSGFTFIGMTVAPSSHNILGATL